MLMSLGVRSDLTLDASMLLGLMLIPDVGCHLSTGNPSGKC